jgi:hypothetical protein
LSSAARREPICRRRRSGLPQILAHGLPGHGLLFAAIDGIELALGLGNLRRFDVWIDRRRQRLTQAVYQQLALGRRQLLGLGDEFIVGTRRAMRNACSRSSQSSVGIEGGCPQASSTSSKRTRPWMR